MQALRKRWFIGLIIGLPFAAATGAAVWKYTPKTYTTSAVLRIAHAEKQLIFATADNAQRAGNTFEMYKRTQRQMLRSRFVITHALRDEALAKIPALQEQADPVGWLGNNLKVAFPDDAEIMTISLTAAKPEGLHQVVNAIVKSYFEEVVYEERKKKTERLNELEIAHKKFETDLRTKRTDLKQLVERVGGDASSLTFEQQNSIQQYSMLRQQLQRVQFDVMESELEMHNAGLDGKIDPAQLEYELTHALRSDPVAEGLKADRAQITSLIQSTKSLLKKEAAGPRLDELNQRLQSVDRKLEARKEHVRRELEDYKRQMTAASSESLKRKHRLLKAQEQRLESEMRNLEAET